MVKIEWAFNASNSDLIFTGGQAQLENNVVSQRFWARGRTFSPLAPCCGELVFGEDDFCPCAKFWALDSNDEWAVDELLAYVDLPIGVFDVVTVALVVQEQNDWYREFWDKSLPRINGGLSPTHDEYAIVAMQTEIFNKTLATELFACLN